MGAAGSTSQGLQAATSIPPSVWRELLKPLDGSDVAHSPAAAHDEVIRLRAELRKAAAERLLASNLNPSSSEGLLGEEGEPPLGSQSASNKTHSKKEELRKKKAKNKWRRGSFGQIKKADDFWEKLERDQRINTNDYFPNEKTRSPKGESKSGSADELDMVADLQRQLQNMTSEISFALAPSPKGNRQRPEKKPAKKGGLDDLLETRNGGVPVVGPKKKTKRRSFVLEAGLILVESESEEED
jgi:hypothetical protein